MASQEDQAFEKLQMLLDKLPEMQEKGALLAQARQAREVAAIARRLHYERLEFDSLTAEMKKAQAASQAARDNQESPEIIEQRDRELLYWGAMRGYKDAPVKNDEGLLKKALKDGGFADEEEAAAAALPDDEFAALEDEITTYQKEYAETLALCQQYEDAEIEDTEVEDAEEADE